VGVIDLATRYAALGAEVRDATSVVAVGSGTQSGIGGAVRDASEVRAPGGVLDVQPADMTVTVAAGTTCAELRAALAEFGQECPLDPRDARATVGGTLATGLSGLRRLALGPVRDTVLEVVLVRADGRVVRGGGPTVKNVTGYDVPRLAVGSLGTIGVLAQVTLRTRPLPAASTWFASSRTPAELRTLLYAPTAVTQDRSGTRVLLEGHPGDLTAEAARAGLTETDPVEPPSGPHRGRISVAPGAVAALITELSEHPDLEWLAEHGVGTVHVVAGEPARLATARRIAEAHDGWMLREAGAPDLDPFGVDSPALALQRRLRSALDPTGKLARGRVPATEPVAAAA
jgi:glycolate oxidase FAD binding subunit